jgi:integrase
MSWGPHTLRHVAASLWIAQGISPKKAQQLLGHATLQMTMDLTATSARSRVKTTPWRTAARP